ncbi:RagB/SusD family nutrient uptake outer membrane protein [Autumnicola edwardsiae]|uniref:RagB/SusD family nutrient uptake outer membrane protein n=1 Tax=Autumnicola edwardsiae TaxID=3075594 RepID=A0ABU3CWK3_9FLAO|nr:RagB/SusD family nutrient uptake outer membrane protein [Zunongwangia sp. F297]MDT0650592.1 RagB/SusD family nutrient uptake outer membrane protein [Zunongwangia sp. F297]
MKNLIKSKVLVLVALSAVLFFPSCSEDFLDRPPEDSYSVDNFYQTNRQVASASNHLYSKPWFNFISNVAWPIGEIASGNARTWDARNQEFSNYSITGAHGTLTQAWESLYAVIAQSNSVINTLPTAVGPDISEVVVNNSIAEARYIRATAYFYLVRIFGSVPILADNTDYVLEPVVARNPVEDVYEFIKRDYQFAIENLYDRTTDTDIQAGRVSSNSAKAALSKIYLYEENWSMAYQLSNEVIQSGEFALLENYNDLFLEDSDNNVESVFALQWANTGIYAEGNAIQSFYASAGITGFSDGWAALGPSIDLQESYETGDERYYATIMEPGAFYPSINGGFTVPETINHQGTNVGIKKYVIGNPSNGASQSYPNNTYILRYAEVLLINAEAAIMGGGPVQEGVESFNQVRTRAGLDPIQNPDIEDIFHERRIELALELEFWYDVVRRGPEFAIEFLGNIERGPYNNDTTPPTVDSEQFVPTAEDLLYPYPTSEIQSNPALLEDPVPYDFDANTAE